MRNQLIYKAQKGLKPLLVVALLATMIFTNAFAVLAQGTTTTITFGGKPLSGSTSEVTALLLNDLRPAVAQAPVEQFANTAGYKPVVYNDCFGEVESGANGNMLLETVYKTDRANNRFNAVAPGANEHGDWPPHLVWFNLQANRALDCGELVAEVSYRMRFEPKVDTQITYSFSLDSEALAKEYDVMASKGQDATAGLGLFVMSSTPITVNNELLSGTACHDCPAHTAAVTTTIGTGIYTSKDVTWFGQAPTNKAPGLTAMYVLPLKKEAGVISNVTIDAPAGSHVWIFFGRFDLPGYNVPAK